MLTNSNSNFNYHIFITNLMKALHYEVDKEGVCTGLMMVGIRAFFDETLEDFNKFLTSLETSKDVLQEINQVKLNRIAKATQKKENPNDPFYTVTEEEQKSLTILSYLDAIALYQNPQLYSEVFNQNISQHDSYKAGDILLNPNKSHNKLQKLHNWAGIYKKEELGTYLKTLQKSIQTLNQNTAISLGSADHIISICYNSETESWLLIDANQLPAKTFEHNSLAALEEAIFTAFWKDQILAFETTLYTVGEFDPGLAIGLQKFQKTSEEFLALHKITAERAAYQTNDGVTLAFIAARTGNIELLDELSKFTNDLNHPTHNGATPIFIAAQRGHADVIEKLAKYVPNIHAVNNKKQAPLHIAAYKGQINAIEMLTNFGGNLNCRDFEDKTPAHFAVLGNHPNAVEVIAQLGGNINAYDEDDNTPLSIASENGLDSFVPIFAKFNVNLDQADELGITAAYLAAEKGHAAFIKALAQYGANVNQPREDGYTPMHIAAQEGHANTVRTLFQCGADINAARKDGMTPALIAAFKGQTEVLKVLAELGVDLRSPGPNGQTPLDYAKRGKHVKTIEFLNNYKVETPFSFFSDSNKNNDNNAFPKAPKKRSAEEKEGSRDKNKLKK